MSKIIVVDDDQTNATLIQMLLELDGFTVTAFSGVEEAKEKVGADTDAFVIDFYLTRDTNGLELLHAIRTGETAAARDTAVIITSGDYRREVEAGQAGADLFLTKPYAPDILSQELNKLLTRET